MDQVTIKIEGLLIGGETHFSCSVNNYRPRGNLSLNLDGKVFVNFQSESQTHMFDNTSKTYMSLGKVHLKTNQTWDGREFRCCVILDTHLSQCSDAEIVRVKGKKTVIY